MKIRSITLFDHLSPRPEHDLARLGDVVAAARAAYEAAGHEVQTTRLATCDFEALTAQAASPVDWAARLEAAAQVHGFEYVSLGIVPRAALAWLPEIFAATEAVFASADLLASSPDVAAIDGVAVYEAARVIYRAAEIEAGFGNLRFTASANVPPGTPFFPAAYHDGGPTSFALAMESADLAVTACQKARDAADVRQRLRAAIEREAAGLISVAERLADQHGIRFGGLDFSLAPFPTAACSIGAALERIAGGPLGCPGTLAAAALLTDAIDQAKFPRAGFCGLMLPVLEDLILGQRAAEGRLKLASLLQWSAVCGTGLDTVPLPGDLAPATLAHILWDVAALSLRLDKPLTARLMPLPGKRAGDPVHFDFAYFADGGVLEVAPPLSPGHLSRETVLPLTARAHHP